MWKQGWIQGGGDREDASPPPDRIYPYSLVVSIFSEVLHCYYYCFYYYLHLLSLLLWHPTDVWGASCAHDSSPTSPPTPAVQVKQYSWRHNAKTNKCFYDKRREFVNSDKHTNHASLFLPQQAPLVSQAHLLSVVRKVEKSERFKGKLQQKFVVKVFFF